MTFNLAPDTYKMYESKYGNSVVSDSGKSHSTLNETTGLYQPSFSWQCMKYFLVPVAVLDIAMQWVYYLLQLSCFDIYSLTSVAFLKLVFMFFLWGALESNFFNELTDNLLGTSMTTPMPFSVNSDGSFSAGIGPASVVVNMTDMTNTLRGTVGAGDTTSNMVSLIMMILYLTFWGMMLYDMGFQGSKFISGEQEASVIPILFFVLKWFFFISFISNFSFLIFIFAWFYLIIMTFFGYFFAHTSIKHDFMGDFFKNTYANVLDLDLKRYEFIKELKNIRSQGDKDSKAINQVIENISTYNAIQNNIISVIQYTQNSPTLTGLVIFISFCFTTLMIETGQIANVTITFFMVNLLLFLLLIIALIIIYFGFNMFKNYNEISYTNINEKATRMFQNVFDGVIGQKSTTTTKEPLMGYSSIDTPPQSNQPPLTKQPIERIEVTREPYHNFYGGKQWIKRHQANEILTNGGDGVILQ